jgi:hypothetical protein
MQTDDKRHTTILNIYTKFQLSHEEEINITKHIAVLWVMMFRVP